MDQPREPYADLTRRKMLQATAGAAALAWAGRSSAADAPAEGPVARRGRVNQSIVHWCFAKEWDVEQTCQAARKLGCKSVELVAAEHWPMLKKYGLVCAIAPSHLFVQGMNNPRYHAGCMEMLKKSIDDCADAGFQTVITFTGYAQETGDWADGGLPDLTRLPAGERRVIEPDEGIKNCVEGFKKVVAYAEQKKVNLSLEMLNTRVSSHPMKGHPGYQGDHIDYCLEIIKQVGSPRLGLLFDIYHVQIMDGDLITRVDECKEYTNHVHTAGNPGRGELDDNQEINYAAVMRALVETGYKGYVGQEFIPTRDPLEGLKQAVAWCDV